MSEEKKPNPVIAQHFGHYNADGEFIPTSIALFFRDRELALGLFGIENLLDALREIGYVIADGDNGERRSR